MKVVRTWVAEIPKIRKLLKVATVTRPALVMEIAVQIFVMRAGMIIRPSVHAKMPTEIRMVKALDVSAPIAMI